MRRGKINLKNYQLIDIIQKDFIIQKFANLLFYQNQIKIVSAMEDAIFSPPNNSGQLLRLEIKQKSTYIKKRKVKTWSPEEDDQLVKLYDEYPKKWGIIASLMQDRNENQCLHRYRRLSQLGAHKKIWSAQEDQTILSLIKKVGKNWKLLAEIIGSKTGKQIRQRFINKLDPKIKTEQWTDQEDRLILKYYSQVGSKWSEISKKLPGRPQNKIKNRFYSYIQKNYDIRYIYADQSSLENSKQKVTISTEKNTEKDCYRNLNISQESQRKPEPVERAVLKQLSENQNDYGKSQNLKLKRKTRLRPTYSRFSERKSEQNIFQDQNQATPKGTKSTGRPKKLQNCELPSIRQLQDEFKIALVDLHPQNRAQQNQNINLAGSIYQVEQKDQIFDSNNQLSQKYYIKSLIRVQDQLAPIDNKYRSIRDLVSNGDIENHDNELFYLSQH